MARAVSARLSPWSSGNTTACAWRSYSTVCAVSITSRALNSASWSPLAGRDITFSIRVDEDYYFIYEVEMELWGSQAILIPVLLALLLALHLGVPATPGPHHRRGAAQLTVRLVFFCMHVPLRGQWCKQALSNCWFYKDLERHAFNCLGCSPTSLGQPGANLAPAARMPQINSTKATLLISGSPPRISQ